MNTKFTIYIDGWCKQCRKFARIINKIDFQNAILINDIRVGTKDLLNIDIEFAKKYIASIDTYQKVNYGFKTIYIIVQKLPLLWIFFPMFFILKITSLGNLFYNEIAIKRKILPLHCDESDCKIIE